MRNKCTVKRVTVLPFSVSKTRPFVFKERSSILVWITRTYADGKKENSLLTVEIRPMFTSDGASTFWPFSMLVPQWREGDDEYNAGPVVHDILYILEGQIQSEAGSVKLSREEVDDILRGIWRCWGMSRFVAGCADKAVELVAGGKKHWGNDSYNVKQFVSTRWEVLE